MTLHIDRLDIELPVSLGARRHGIMQQLRSELSRLEWPAGEWRSLEVDAIAISPRQTNIDIARHIARQMHRAAFANCRGE